MNTVKFNDKVKQFKPSKKIKASPSTHDFRKVNANNLINGSIFQTSDLCDRRNEKNNQLK